MEPVFAACGASAAFAGVVALATVDDKGGGGAEGHGADELGGSAPGVLGFGVLGFTASTGFGASAAGAESGFAADAAFASAFMLMETTWSFCTTAKP